MIRTVTLAVGLCALGLACVPKKGIEASSTIEEIENEAPPDAGATVAATPTTTPPPREETPPSATLTLTPYEATEGFTIGMPTKEPQVQRNSVPLKKGGSVNTVSVSANVDGIIYSVTRAEYPEAMAKKKGAKAMMTETREGLAKQLKGAVNDEKDAEFAGHPGETFTIAGEKTMVRSRTVIVNNQLYSLIVVYAGKVPDKADEFLGGLTFK